MPSDAAPAGLVCLNARAHSVGQPGLGCGFVGDVLLLSDKKSRFIGGAAAFLAAMCCTPCPSCVRWPSGRPSGSSCRPGSAPRRGSARLWDASAASGGDEAPVLCYLLAICAMAFFASLRALSAGDLAALLCLIGALCFLLSDYLLAVGNFKRPFFKMDFWIMLTYLCAQLLIILSFVRGLPTF